MPFGSGAAGVAMYGSEETQVPEVTASEAVFD